MTNYAPVVSNDRPDWPAGGYLIVFEALPYVLAAIDGREENSLKEMKWDASKQLLAVHLDVKRGSPSKPFLAEYELWIDPANNWRVVELKSRAPSGSVHNRTTYGPPIDGLSFPLEFYQHTTSADPSEPPTTTRGTFQVHKAARPPRDFRLSAYGLPEPVQFPERKTVPTYVWLLAGAAVCLVIALGFRYLARRRGARTAV